MKFVALDVETANPSTASICQIGFACYENGELTTEWKSLIDPEEEFSGMNVSIHGIDEDMVVGAPKFPDIFSHIQSATAEAIVVTHTHFDRTALRQAAVKYGLPSLNCLWLDSARIARRTWEEFAWKGFGLANICGHIGYKFKHHDALEDAKAAAAIVLAATKVTKTSLEDWIRRVEEPISRTGKRGAIEQVLPGPLSGETIVFTGSLSIARIDAGILAAEVGCQVADNVTKKTTLLVVGDQDIRALRGQIKSSKHRKAELLISSGQTIRILCERDFIQLVEEIRS